MRTFNVARGFTLVEVLVALVLMAMLATMAWQGVDGMVRARDISQENAEHTLRLTTVLGAVGAGPAVAVRQPHGAGAAFDGATLRLMRVTPRALQVVVWSLRDGVGGAGPARASRRASSCSRRGW